MGSQLIYDEAISDDADIESQPVVAAAIEQREFAMIEFIKIYTVKYRGSEMRSLCISVFAIRI
jgi:hypothetical protein